MTLGQQTVAPRPNTRGVRSHPRGVALELPTNEWVPMAKVYPVFDGPYPSHVMIDDQRVRVAMTWREVYGHVVSWMVATDVIADVLEFPGTSGRCIVNTDPVHCNGDQFSQPYELPNGWWLEVGGPEPLQFERTLELLKRMGVDAGRVKVMLEHRDDAYWN